MRGFSHVTERGWHRHEIPDTDGGADTGADTGHMELVWLHGWGLNGESLMPLARLFASRAKSHIFDLPGFGKTAMPAPGAGTKDYAEALSAQLPEGREFVLLSHSFGARVALRFALRYPEKVRGIVLIAGAGLKRRRSLVFRLRARALRLLGRAAHLSDRLFSGHLKDAYGRRFGSADYKNAGDLRATFVRVVNEDLSEEARRIKVPVLLIYGRDDHETPPEIGARYAALIPDAQLHVLEGFGHLDILTRGAYQCQSLINRYLERL